MKVYKILLFLIFIFSSFCFAWGKPDYCSNFYKKNNINAFKIDDFYAFDESNIFVICSAGIHSFAPTNIISSKNGGKTWRVRWSSTKTILNKLHFLDGKIGFAVGADYKSDEKNQSLILKTTNGGLNWKQIPFMGNDSIEDISFINKSVGFAVTEDGLLLKTINSGETWQTFETVVKPYVSQIYFSDEMNGWIITLENRFNETLQDEIRDGNIYRTQDGGKTWISQRERFWDLLKQWNPTEIRFQKVKFFTSKIGYVAAHFEQIEKKPNDAVNYLNYIGGAVFSTKNGGEIWDANLVTEDFGLNYAHFDTNGKFWVIPSRIFKINAIYSSSNFGKSWGLYSTKFTNGDADRIYFLNNKIGFLITRLGMENDNIYRTLDGGKTWQLR